MATWDDFKKQFFKKVASADAAPNAADAGVDADYVNLDEGHCVNASELEYLLRHGHHPVGVKLTKVEVVADQPEIDLELEDIRMPLILKDCTVRATLKLEQSKIHAIQIIGGELQGLRARELQCESGVWIQGVEVKAGIDLTAARLKGDLNLSPQRPSGRRTVIHCNPDKSWAIAARQLRCSGSLKLNSSILHGEVRLTGATVEGNIDCLGASIEHEEIGSNCSIPQLRTRFGVSKEFGNLELDRSAPRIPAVGHRSNAEAPMLYGVCMQHIGCGGSVFIDKLVSALPVTLLNSRIRGQLLCRGARLEVLLLNGLQCEDVVVIEDMQDTQYGGAIVQLRGVKIHQRLQVNETTISQLDLFGANVGVLVIDGGKREGEKPKIVRIDGLTYGGIFYRGQSQDTVVDITKDKRMAWLEAATHGDWYSSQPYTQFARTLESAGKVGFARFVRRRREELRTVYIEHLIRTHPDFRAASLPSRVWSKVYGWLAGHGYAPRRIAWTSVACVGLFIASFMVLLVANGGSASLWSGDCWEFAVYSALRSFLVPLKLAEPTATCNTSGIEFWMSLMSALASAAGWLLLALLVTVAQQLVRKD